MKMTSEDIINFWFYEVGRERWFIDDPALDQSMREKFEATYEKAIAGELEAWSDTPEGTLALLLLFDEFPRRMYRGTPKAFATDDEALETARNGIIKHFDDRIAKEFKMLFYLPFMNSESLGDQRLALYYIRERAKEQEWLSVAEQHYEIVQRFGRFPQRNPVLGREPTPEELEFLNTKGQA